MLRFTVAIFLVIVCIDAQKSCTSLVKYGKESAGGEGIVTIAAPKISNHELKVKFTLDSRLRSTYAGDIGLTKSAEEAVKDIRHGTPLNYRVKFPPGSQSQAKIVSIQYNEKELCNEKADEFQTLVTLTHQLDTGVKLETETVDTPDDTLRSAIPISPKKKVEPVPQLPRISIPTKESTLVKQPTLAESKGNDIFAKINSGQFKPIAIFNTQDLLEKQPTEKQFGGVQEINNANFGTIPNLSNVPNRHRPPYVGHHYQPTVNQRKDVDLTLRIPGPYIENAVVAIVISVADAYNGTRSVLYQNAFTP